MSIQLHQLRKALVLTAFTAAAVSVGQAQVTVPSTFVLPSSAADISKPGFIWRVSQVVASEPNQLSWAESQLAGLRGNNYADLTAIGPATGNGTPGATANDPITFNIPGFVNFSKDAGGSKGDFPNDDQMPGIPGTGGGTDNIAAEALFYIDLPAGETDLVVNSDDGFRLTIGGAVPQDKYGSSTVIAGQFDGGRGAADTVCPVVVSKAGLYAARVLYEQGGGDANVEISSYVVSGGSTNLVLVNDFANGGLKAYAGVTTPPAGAYVSALLPSPDDIGVSPLPTITATLVDGPAPIDPSKVTLSLDGSVVPATTTRNGNVTTSTYTAPTVISASSLHTAVLTYFDNNKTQTNRWSFTTAGYANLDPKTAVTPDTTKPGFVFNIFANSSATTSDNAFRDNGEQGLNGRFTDGTTPYANLADTTVTGPATGPGVIPSTSAPASYTIPGVINLSGVAGSALGVFGGDQQMPGTPATDAKNDGIEGEVLTYVQLPAGLTSFGVGTPDVFNAYVGNWDYTQSIAIAGNQGPGGVSYQFYVNAPQAGVYPVRVSFTHANTADLGLELFTVLPSGKKVLVNDTANGGYPAYRATATPAGPYVKFTSPSKTPHQLNQPSSNILVRVIDGGVALNDNSPVLAIDGKTVPVKKARVGNVLELTFTPTSLFTESETHHATLTYADAAGKSYSNSWSFMNLKALWLPTKPAKPGLFDDFESYPEGTTFLPSHPLPNVPTNLPATVYGPEGVLGSTWYAWDFTYVEDQANHGGNDVTDPSSNYYLSWVVVSLDPSFKGIEGDSVNVAPGQTLNGAEVTEVASGQVFIAESDNRYGGNSAVPNSGQVQFAYSKDYDLTGVTNPVVSFGSVRKQNQDDLACMEYSVDQGATWNPVIYYLDGGKLGSDSPDIFLNFDGTVDVVGTLTTRRGEVPTWLDDKGVNRGRNYGDGIAAPITQALAPYFAPRINDNGTEGKRIEAVRIPLAANKSHVRLRLGQLGTCSWYFGIDNLGFYDVPPFAPLVPVITGITTTGNNVTVTWTNGGTLEYAPTLTSTTWTSTGNSSGTYTEALSGTKFFRVRN